MGCEIDPFYGFWGMFYVGCVCEAIIFHQFEKVSPNEPNMGCFLCVECYFVMFVGHVSSTEKHECMS